MAVGSLVALWIVLAALLPDPLAIHPEQRLDPLTDHLGRSIPARLVHGVGHSVILVLLVLTPSLLVAIPTGFWAASSRRAAAGLDTLAGAIWSLPTLIIGLVVFATLKGQYVEVKYAALGLFNWVPVYRAVRDLTRQVRVAPYYEFGRALGLSPRHLAARVTWPNVWPEVLPVVALNIATLFEAEFVLAFLGLSYPAPTPTLGSMLRQGLDYLHPPLVLLPVAVIAIVISVALLSGSAANIQRISE